LLAAKPPRAPHFSLMPLSHGRIGFVTPLTQSRLFRMNLQTRRFNVKTGE